MMYDGNSHEIVPPYAALLILSICGALLNSFSDLNKAKHESYYIVCRGGDGVMSGQAGAPPPQKSWKVLKFAW